MDSLLPCPFCGGPVELEHTQRSRHWWGVVCRNTMNRGGSCAIEQVPSASKEAATARWNMRASPWQPIETAPTEMRVLVDSEVCSSPVIAFRTTYGTWVGTVRPTKWMPLPELQK